MNGRRSFNNVQCSWFCHTLTITNYSNNKNIFGMYVITWINKHILSLRWDDKTLNLRFVWKWLLIFLLIFLFYLFKKKNYYFFFFGRFFVLTKFCVSIYKDVLLTEPCNLPWHWLFLCSSWTFHFFWDTRFYCLIDDTFPYFKFKCDSLLVCNLHREIVPPRETVAIARVAIAIVGRGGWGSLPYTVAN